MFSYYYHEKTNTLIRTSPTVHSIIQFKQDGSYDIATYDKPCKEDLSNFKRFEHDEFVGFIKSKYKHDISLEILYLEERVIKLKRQLLNIENNDFSNV